MTNPNKAGVCKGTPTPAHTGGNECRLRLRGNLLPKKTSATDRKSGSFLEKYNRSGRIYLIAKKKSSPKPSRKADASAAAENRPVRMRRNGNRRRAVAAFLKKEGLSRHLVLQGTKIRSANGIRPKE